MPAELPGYQSFDFTHEGTTKKVYWTGDAAHPIWSHSVLTVHYDPTPGSPTRQAYETMLKFFRSQLGNTKAKQ